MNTVTLTELATLKAEVERLRAVLKTVVEHHEKVYKLAIERGGPEWMQEYHEARRAWVIEQLHSLRLRQ